MNKITLLFVSIFFATAFSFSQEVVSMTYLGFTSKTQLDSMFGLPIFSCGAKYYKMDYTSVDAKGQADTLSGLVGIPEVEGATYPLLEYEHGTSGCKTCVPSRYGQSGGEEGQVAVLFGGLGYVTIIPDYVGMGDGRGFQTYVHDSTIVSASNDMYIAFKAWAPNNNVLLNDQLFITGYSQGGYGSMAFYKYMQETHGPNFVTAATCNSGPYSLSGVMRNLILTDSVYSYPAYIPNTYLGMNEYYEIYDSISQVFKAPYVSDIQKYYDGDITLQDLNDRLFDSLVAVNGDAIGHNMLQDSILTQIQNDPNYIINKILRKNDVFRWVPQSPTRIFYCKGDDQVPFRNSEVAIDTMYAMGADQTLVQAVNLNDTMTHSECVTGAFTKTIFFFANYMQTNLGAKAFENYPLKVYPNPANKSVFVECDLNTTKNITIWSLGGKKLIATKLHSNKEQIDVSNLVNGMYILSIQLKNGQRKFQKLVINR